MKSDLKLALVQIDSVMESANLTRTERSRLAKARALLANAPAGKARRVVIRPSDLNERWGVSQVTRWRMERDGRIPARDFFIGGEAVGWHVLTIEKSERG